MENVYLNKNLFWFLKKDTKFDLSNVSCLDMYVQQVITRGRTEDVKYLLSIVSLDKLRGAIKRIGRFIPKDVKRFWDKI